MNQSDWYDFLKQYSHEVLQAEYIDGYVEIPEQAKRQNWLGHKPASQQSISEADQRLGRQLPPSLKSFYQITNGWIALGYTACDILPIEELGWIHEREPDLFQGAKEAESEKGPFKDFKDDPGAKRLKLYRLEQGTRVKRSLVLNSTGDASYWLLDPEVQNPEGEWSAGLLASWQPGMEWSADSFEALMRSELANLIQARTEHS